MGRGGRRSLDKKRGRHRVVVGVLLVGLGARRPGAAQHGRRRTQVLLPVEEQVRRRRALGRQNFHHLIVRQHVNLLEDTVVNMSFVRRRNELGQSKKLFCGGASPHRHTPATWVPRCRCPRGWAAGTRPRHPARRHPRPVPPGCCWGRRCCSDRLRRRPGSVAASMLPVWGLLSHRRPLFWASHLLSLKNQGFIQIFPGVFASTKILSCPESLDLRSHFNQMLHKSHHRHRRHPRWR